MPQDLQHTTTQVFINGKRFLFSSLRLDQYLNGHHIFDIVLKGKPLPNECIWAQDRNEMVDNQGAEVLIKMTESPGGKENIFKGIVTGVQITGGNSDSGTLHYRGYSPTILLESNKNMDSFTNMNLTEIVDEVTGSYGNGIKISKSPSHTGKIPYVQQHEESGYAFLRRLAHQYGEWCYYDGEQFHWGIPGKDENETLIYNKDLSDLNFFAGISPFHSSRHDYHPSENQITETGNIPPTDVGNIYVKSALKNSDAIYKSESILHSSAIVESPAQVKDILEIENARQTASLVRISGKSTTCRIRIGKVVIVSIPQTMGNQPDMGRYRVTRISHIIESSGRYRNEFEALPAEIKYFPADNIVFPYAYPTVAVITSNADPDNQGRVKVEFPWQHNKGKTTNWIRVQSPDAGSGKENQANRGFVFIPEEGDQVMVSFELGDPARPYVSGSLFHGKNGKGGGKDNYLHSIVTKSGHCIEFNDDSQGEWGIIIRDDSGNTIHLNTKEKNIEISSPETISLTAKNISIAASESLDLVAEKKAVLAAKSELDIISEGKLTVQSKQDTQLSSNSKISAKAMNEINIHGQKVELNGTAQVKVNSTGTMQISGAMTDIQGSTAKIKIT